MELKAGIKIHGYTLVEFISSGATAEVWKIKDDNGIEKALKIFSPVQKVDDATLDLLIDEFKLLYKLDHPHILKSEIMGAFQKVPYIIMPYYNGNLASEMTKRSYQSKSPSRYFNDWFSEDECVTLMQQIGSGLTYLHGQGIIHQDVKPENILFDSSSDQPDYVLTDFGISTRIKENIARMTLPRNQAYALTPAYAAPEQFNGHQDFKSDVFSLGVLLFEMSEGRLPFSRHGYAPDAYGNIGKSEFRNPHLSAPFKNIILSALSENPSLRPAARDFEDYAIQSKGNTIIEREGLPLRTDKITVFQHPAFSKQESNQNTPSPKDTPQQEFCSSPTVRTTYDPIRSDISDQGIPEKMTPVGRSKKKKNRLYLIVVFIVLLVVVLFGYFRYSEISKTRMKMEADEYFANGKMKEANMLYTKIARKYTEEEYYSRKILTDSILGRKYNEILGFENDRAPVRKNGKWGYIDPKGKLVVDCIYTTAGEFINMTAFVCKSPNECGVIDINGFEQTAFKYDGFWAGDKDSWELTWKENGRNQHEKIKF